jgi:hypothetical protein
VTGSKPNSHSGPVPLAGVLQQMNVELEGLAHALGKVEHTVAGMVAKSGGGHREMLPDLQRIDSIVQTLTALAAFSQRLSTLVPGGLHVDVHSAVKSLLLSDVAGRLRGSHGHAGSSSEWASGDAEFFDL